MKLKSTIILENKNVVEQGNNRSTSCSAFTPPQNVVQNNKVPVGVVSNKSWSNVRGYGNIVVATHDTESNMHGRLHPWNRINPLSSPYETPVVTKQA